MADPGHLAELQRKFEENPRRYFAPLASEFRKAGDPERAIALCRAYLPEQPGHMSGYVVYGQALFDAGHQREAVEAFEQALTLDPENMIAMRYLGDLAREGGDLDRATHWYRQLLDLDPKDEALSAYLAELASQGPSVVNRHAPAYGEPEPWVEERAEMHPPMEPIPVEPTSTEDHQESAPQEGFEVAEEFSARATPLAGEPPPFEEVHAPPEVFFSETEQQLESDATGEALFVPHEPLLSEPIPPEAVLAWAQMADPLLEMPEPSAPLEPLADATGSPVPPEPHAVPEEPVQDEPAGAVPAGEAHAGVQEAGGEVQGEEHTEEGPAPEEPPEQGVRHHGGVPMPFVTETMATLYLQQGFTARALAVYRQLAALRAEPRLQDKIRELEETLAAEAVSVRDFFTRIGARRPATGITPPVTPSGGVSALFASVPADERDARAAAALANAYTPRR